MRVGLVVPQNELGVDPGALRELAQGAEHAGFSHLLVFDHVVGRSYDPDDYAGRPWREPLVVLAYLAALTTRIELATGIVIGPQRQTVLLAKQVAELELLSAGRLRLGLGVGWNPQEYAALGQDFATRGKRLDAQLPLLRQLWEEPAVEAELGAERLERVGLNPLPPRRIPLWFGGKGPAAIRRAVTHGDGVMLTVPTSTEYPRVRAELDAAATAVGRSADELGVEVWINACDLPASEWAEEIERYRAAGASHLSVMLTGATPSTPSELLARAAAVALKV